MKKFLSLLPTTTTTTTTTFVSSFFLCVAWTLFLCPSQPNAAEALLPIRVVSRPFLSKSSSTTRATSTTTSSLSLIAWESIQGVPFSSSSSSSTTLSWAARSFTIEAPTRERTKTNEEVQRRQRRRRRSYEQEEGLEEDDNYNDDEYYDEAETIRREGPLEYLQDDMSVSREMNDPFHILLLGTTFDKPKITVTYVSGSLEYVLDMPSTEALEQSKFARDHGMSCLGTWSREECLSLGKQLQVRDIVCRVVPFCEGGQRGWQAKDASSSKSSNSRGEPSEAY